MQHNTISPLIMQNRLLSQARSGARAQSAAIGSAIQRTNSKNSGDSDSVKMIGKRKKNNKLLEESRENFTALKKAAEEVRERSKKTAGHPRKGYRKHDGGRGCKIQGFRGREKSRIL